jgi:Holliday junction DNA helicase RuvB
MLHRPATFEDIVGCESIKEMIKREAFSAQARNQQFPHMLVYGGPGLGKTTIASLVASQMGDVEFKTFLSNVFRTKEDVKQMLSELNYSEGYDERSGNIIGKIKPTVVFLDEIHQIKRNVQEAFFQAMEDFVFTAEEKDRWSSTNKKRVYWVPRFTLIGATTQAGDLDGPFRERFGIQISLDFYSTEEICEILRRYCKRNEIKFTEKGLINIAKRSRGTARRAINYLDRSLTTLIILKANTIDEDIAEETFNLLGIDNIGLDSLDMRLLKYLYSIYPQKIGINRLSSVLNVADNILKDITEPYLLRSGLIDATPGGRMISELGMRYCEDNNLVPKIETEAGISGRV